MSSPEDTVVDPAILEQAHRAMARSFAQQYGVLAWYGCATRHWWAMTGGQLLEADQPKQLAQKIRRARGCEQ